MRFIEKIDFVDDNECQEITLDDGTIIYITEEYISINNDCQCEEKEDIVIERKSISKDNDNHLAVNINKQLLSIIE
jgi:hypothetical protein